MTLLETRIAEMNSLQEMMLSAIYEDEGMTREGVILSGRPSGVSDDRIAMAVDGLIRIGHVNVVRDQAGNRRYYCTASGRVALRVTRNADSVSFEGERDWVWGVVVCVLGIGYLMWRNWPK